MPIRRRRHAFTLLEVMLVLLIIGLLATVAAVNLVGASDRAREQQTKTSIKMIESALKQYYFTHGRYPTSEEGLMTLVPDYLESQPLDAWKRPFVYFSPGTGGRDFEIISLGRDGNADTEDDIVSWELE
ncbi:MAG: type II secretion system protein GspG [Phycisphaerales bacterium]|nr:MAG: type II secretion system protein GspG [Phycisphaerales bacterium]